MNSCVEIEVRFLPLCTGYVHIEALRVVDVATGESMDIVDLPDFIVVKNNR